MGLMADDPLSEVVDTAAEAVPLAISPKKWIAFKTALSYVKTMLATAGKFVPVVAMLGGPPAISQAPPARVEDVGAADQGCHARCVLPAIKSDG